MKPNTKHTVAVAIALVLIYAVSALGQPSVPQLVNYQGKLTDAQGEPLPTAEYTLSFAIYSVSVEPVEGEGEPVEGEGEPVEGEPVVTDTLVWGPQTFDSVPVMRGYFNVILGPQDDTLRDLAAVFANTPELYLEISVNGDAITPRQQMLSVPYAMNAEHAAEADHALVSDVALFSPPIGSIIAWHKSVSGMPALPDGWVECNGGLVVVPGSPIFGQQIPNLNGSLTSVSGVSTKGYFLRGDTTSGGTQGNQSNAISQVRIDDNNDVTNSEAWVNVLENGMEAWTYASHDDGDRDAFILRRYGRETRPHAFTVVWIMRVM